MDSYSSIEQPHQGMRRTTSILSAGTRAPRSSLVLAVLVIGVASGLPAAISSAEYYYKAALDAAEMSLEAYGNSSLRSGDLTARGWEVKDSGMTSSGLNWTVFERVNSRGITERTLAFAGTEFASRDGTLDLNDAYADYRQFTDVGIPTAQYRDALTMARRHLAQADKDPKLLLAITGHSLGGGLAQYVSLKTGIRAIVFNSAPLGVSTQWAFGPEIAVRKAELASANILNIRMQGDAVSALSGTQHGLKLVLQPPAGTTRWQQGYLHSMENLIRGLKRLRGDRITSSLFTSGRQETRFVLNREHAEHLASVVGTAAGAMQELEVLAKHNATLGNIHQNPALRELLDPGREGFHTAFDYASKLYDLATAIEGDIAAHQSGRYSILTSHTLEQVGSMGLDIMLPRFYEVLQKHHVVKQAYPTLGGVEFLVGASRQIGSGRLDVDTITHYLDGLNSAVWGALGLVVSGGNAKVAGIYQSVGDTLAKTGRAATRGFFARGFARHRGQHEILAEMWRTQQESAIHRGLKVQSIEDFLGTDGIKENGFSRSDVSELNAEFVRFQERQASSRAMIETDMELNPLRGGVESEVGGVLIRVVPKRNPGGRSPVSRESILKARGSTNDLFWDLKIKQPR